MWHPNIFSHSTEDIFTFLIQSLSESNKYDVLYFSNCDSEEDRVNVSLSRSTDFGGTWEKIMLNESGGYSNVCVNPVTGTAFVVYESQHESEIRAAEVEIG